MARKAPCEGCRYCVAVDIESRATDVGADALTQVMPNPLLRPDVLEPPGSGPFPYHPVEVAVLVDIHKRGLAHLAADFVNPVVLEFREFSIST
jgi:hypothetical protein